MFPGRSTHFNDKYFLFVNIIAQLWHCWRVLDCVYCNVNTHKLWALHQMVWVGMGSLMGILTMDILHCKLNQWQWGISSDIKIHNGKLYYISRDDWMSGPKMFYSNSDIYTVHCTFVNQGDVMCGLWRSYVNRKIKKIELIYTHPHITWSAHRHLKGGSTMVPFLSRTQRLFELLQIGNTQHLQPWCNITNKPKTFIGARHTG